MKNDNELIQVAKIGRLVGLRGELRLNIHCDFPEQFKPNTTFMTDKNFNLQIESFNPKKNTILFKGYSSRDSAAKLVNLNLFTTAEETSRECKLEEGEFFWFDMIGSVVQEKTIILGTVKDIERMGLDDYLLIDTNDELLEQGLAKAFYLPYIDRYIVSFDKDKKIVHSKDALDILKNS